MTVRALEPLKVLQTRLQGISTASGFHTDAGASVYLGRSVVYSDDAPAITITQDDDEEAQIEVTASLVRKAIPYVVEGIIAADHDNPYEQGYELLADMDQAIFSAGRLSDERLDDTAMAVEYTGSRVQEAEDGSAYCTARVLLTITHTEKLGEPGKAS